VPLFDDDLHGGSETRLFVVVYATGLRRCRSVLPSSVFREIRNCASGRTLMAASVVAMRNNCHIDVALGEEAHVKDNIVGDTVEVRS